MKHFFYLFNIVFLSLFVTTLQAQNLGCSLKAPKNLTVTNITSNSAVANWTLVTNAIAYDVEVVDVLTKTVVFKIDANTSPVNLTGLAPNTLYEVRVTPACVGGSLGSPAVARFVTMGIIIEDDVVQLQNPPKDELCGCSATIKTIIKAQNWITDKEGCEGYLILINGYRLWIKKDNNTVSVCSANCQKTIVPVSVKASSVANSAGIYCPSLLVKIGSSNIAHISFDIGRFEIKPLSSKTSVEIRQCNAVCTTPIIKVLSKSASDNVSEIIDEEDLSDITVFENDFEVYPSMVQDLLQIKYNNVEEGTTFTILNLNGQHIAAFKASSEQDLILYEASSLRNGMYVVIMQMPNGERKVKRFFK